MDYDVCRAWKVHLSTSTKHLHLICDVYKKKWLGLILQLLMQKFQLTSVTGHRDKD